MGSGASIDGENAKDADDVDGKDREKLVECTKSMKELLHIVRQRLKRSKKSASGMRTEFARLSCIVDMINAELRVATLLHLKENNDWRAAEMQELQLKQAGAALKAAALHSNEMKVWQNVTNVAKSVEEAQGRLNKAEDNFEKFRSDIQTKMKTENETEAFAEVVRPLSETPTWKELITIEEFDNRKDAKQIDKTTQDDKTSLSFILSKYSDAFDAQQELHELAKRVKDEVTTNIEVQVVLPALKGFERFFEKGAEKYDFDFGRVSDLSRCTIQICDKNCSSKALAVQTMMDVVHALKNGARGNEKPYSSQPYEVIKCSNKFKKEMGYMDLNFNLVFDKFKDCGSTVCEIQLNFESILEKKEGAHKNYELARALHVFDNSAKFLVTSNWDSASKALETGRIEHLILEGDNIPPAEFAPYLTCSKTKKLQTITLKMMTKNVLAEVSGNAGGESNACPQLTELTLSDSPVTSSLTPSNIQSFKNLSTLRVIETSISDASQHLLSSDVVESLENRGVTIHLKLGPSFEFACTPSGVSYFDVMALSSIFEHTQGYNWNNKEGWLKKNVPVKDWFGVTLADGGRHVHSLNLAENNLVGKCVPAHISPFSSKLNSLNIPRKSTPQIPGNICLLTPSLM
jgi:hypothetical protein